MRDSQEQVYNQQQQHNDSLIKEYLRKQANGEQLNIEDFTDYQLRVFKSIESKLAERRYLPIGNCGDGTKIVAEGCDDGNNVNGDGCSSTCTVEAGWTCVLDAVYLSFSVCTENKDGIWRGGLACDEAITTGGCTAAGTILAGWYCNGVVGSPDSCSEYCGDGAYYYNNPARCDDGNNVPFDGCDANCFVESGWTCTQVGNGISTCTQTCGDGVDLKGNIGCDDGNTLNGDGCSSTCTVETGYYCYGGSKDRPDVCEEICGDGFDYHQHECDRVYTGVANGCSQKCQIMRGWTCNIGMPGNADTCWTTCGDGLRVGAESCDDGNANNAAGTATDGCRNCNIHYGWYCYGGSEYQADMCREICGDGIDFYHYQCDDGNLIDGDGCNGECQVERGYTCAGGSNAPDLPDVCTEICGDGHNLGTYQCDDGNNVNGDGCTFPGCTIEPGWDCGYGSPDTADFCWPIERPMIEGAAISDDNSIIIVNLNRTVRVDPITSMNDFSIKIYGPRQTYWYPMSYFWTNELQLKNVIGKDYFTFAPDYSHEYIQLFGDRSEYFEITFQDQKKVYHSIWADQQHTLINNFAFIGYLSSPKESSYKCGMEYWWQLAWWSYIALVAINIPTAIILKVPMYYSWGLTSSLQIVAMTPIMKSYMPSCLTFFLKDFMISFLKHQYIQDWFYSQTWLGFIYGNIPAVENPLTYRLGRHDIFQTIFPIIIYANLTIFTFHLQQCDHQYIRNACDLGMFLCLSSSLKFTGEKFDLISGLMSFLYLALCFLGMGVIFFYIFALKSTPLYKMRERTCFKMIYDGFNQENRFQLLFYIFYFFKRLFYAIILVFIAEKNLTALNLYIFIVCILPLLYFSYALPFKSRALNAMLCLNEFSEFVVGVVLLHYKEQWIDDDEFFSYAKFLIKYVTIWILMNLLGICIQTAIAITQICTDFWKFKQSKFKERKVESDSDSDDDDRNRKQEEDSSSSEHTPVEEEPETPKEQSPRNDNQVLQDEEDSSSAEEDFDIPAMAVYVDDKVDNIQEIMHEEKKQGE